MSQVNLKNVHFKKTKRDKLKFPFRQNAPLQFLYVCNVNLWPLNELQRNYHSKKFPSFSCSTFQKWFVTICSSEAQLSFVTWHVNSFSSEKAPLTLCFCPPTWGTSKRQDCWSFYWKSNCAPWGKNILIWWWFCPLSQTTSWLPCSCLQLCGRPRKVNLSRKIIQRCFFSCGNLQT